MKKYLKITGVAFALTFSTTGLSQLTADGNAYMLGDYVEIGIDSLGYEGTTYIPGTNARCPLAWDLSLIRQWMAG